MIVLHENMFHLGIHGVENRNKNDNFREVKPLDLVNRETCVKLFLFLNRRVEAVPRWGLAI